MLVLYLTIIHQPFAACGVLGKPRGGISSQKKGSDLNGICGSHGTHEQGQGTFC
jgi:hypothetical protein